MPELIKFSIPLHAGDSCLAVNETATGADSAVREPFSSSRCGVICPIVIARSARFHPAV